MIPSSTTCGSLSKVRRSLKTFGSPSWPLQITYFWLPRDLRPDSHLMPIWKPAPPRPRILDFLTSSITSSGVIVVSALTKPS